MTMLDCDLERSCASTETVVVGPGTVRPAARPRRLGVQALGLLPPSVRTPRYAVPALRPGILHLGCGAFHRGHQALLTQRAIEAEQASRRGAEPPPWGIVAASLQTPQVTRSLSRQDGLFTVLERGPDRMQAEVVGSIRRTLFVPEARSATDAALADPEIRIVTLTITTAGYGIDATTGRLSTDAPIVRRDLHHPHPVGAIGLLTRGFARRRAAGTPPPVVLSCDNMPANGRLLRQACIDYASLYDDALAGWIGREVQFPSTMVDRIVTPTTAVDRRDAARALGVRDAVPVVAEPFSQWVVEHFDGPRPRWDAAGLEYVPDVSPWEASKLRLLNGGHLAIAYVGLLAGYRTVAEVMDVPLLRAFALRFMLDEQKPTLPASDHDIDAYARELLQRWGNHAVVHRLERVGRDGSAKLPSRLLAAVHAHLRSGRPFPCTLLAVAAWMQCVAVDDDRRPLVHDDLAPALGAIGAACGDDIDHRVRRALRLGSVFGDRLAGDARFVAGITDALRTLRRLGPLGAIQAVLGTAELGAAA